jgi:prephenate dehydrogenase
MPERLNKKKPTTIGIIGGKGAMGKWFAKFFKKQGYKVLISDVKTKLTNKQLAEKSDVIIFSVPIIKTPQVIKSVVPHVRPGTLLTDLTSIKTPAVKAMMKAPQNIEVIGMHPMFGPSTKILKNQTIALCPARGKSWLPWLKNVLKNRGAKVKITTAQQHDKIMSIVQGLTHFSTIATAYAFKELKIDLKETLDFVSPVYKMRMNSVGRILAQDPKLYAEIEIFNPANAKTMQQYLKATGKLINIIKNKKEADFVKYFKEAADFLGNFKKQAMKESDYLIEKMAEKK